MDITDHCWPLAPRPLEEPSYLRWAMADHGHLMTFWATEGEARPAPLVGGLRSAVTELVGQWPHTVLRWTLTHARYPGVVLRRDVPLFDELGRIDPPEYAHISLMEDLDTGAVPDPTTARDGVLVI